LLGLTVPFTALTGLSAEPGRLSRLGSITASQASHLAALAALDPAVSWRIILINGDGLALAVARIPRVWAGQKADDAARTRARTRARAGTGARAGIGAEGKVRADQPDADGARQDTLVAQPAQHGLVGRVTLTVPADLLNHLDLDHIDLDHNDLAPTDPDHADLGTAALGPTGRGQRHDLEISPELAESGSAAPVFGGTLAPMIEAALRVAKTTAARVAQHQAADTDAGGCAHLEASSGYRPAPSLREYIAARDQTCRFSMCRQPAARGDLDHTIPWDKGGKTCACNIGGLCRSHHRLKQRLGWNLTQPEPGVFVWATPAGRTYATHPDPHH
jgi:hypothetical protein